MREDLWDRWAKIIEEYEAQNGPLPVLLSAVQTAFPDADHGQVENAELRLRLIARQASGVQNPATRDSEIERINAAIEKLSEALKAASFETLGRLEVLGAFSGLEAELTNRRVAGKIWENSWAHHFDRPDIRKRQPSVISDEAARLFFELTGHIPSVTNPTDANPDTPPGPFVAFLSDIFDALELSPKPSAYNQARMAKARFKSASTATIGT